ncbi:MAG: 3-isopropylmalate dehydratase small subunit [Chthoniobacterales bacterium]
MALEKITQVTGQGVCIPGDDIDTDRIIPARFMKCVTFDGLGEFAFYDERKKEDGSDKTHPLNDPKNAGASILISGRNFGCGSSREHAPQALYRYGFRAVIAESFAEIFFGNSITLGVPCLVASKEDIKIIQDILASNHEAQILIDIVNEKVTADGRDFSATLPAHAKEALLEGHWDAIADLLEGGEEVRERMSEIPYLASVT